VKHKLIVRALRRLCPGFSYVMALDADDILHPDLCAFVARDNNGRGYLIEQGYIVGPAGRVALLAPEPGRYAFWEYCGSCVLVAVDFDRQPWPERLLTRFSHAHHIFGAMARAHGVPPDAVPFPAVLYLFRHGSNASVVHNRISGKQRYLNSFALPAAEARAVLDRFGHRLRPAPKDAAAG
jgi:hypothetical protein